MTRGFIIFWKLFFLFYAIPFPMILYYGISSENPADLINADPRVALGLVILSIILWLIVLAGYYHKWILQIFIAKRRMEWLKNNGVKRNATILTSIDRSIPGIGYSTYELNLSFKNLAGAEIEEKLMVNDARAYERRFMTGNKVEIVLDQNPKDYPYLILSSTQVTIKVKMIILLHMVLLFIAALIAGYYYYSYQTESKGMGWRFMVFYHPLIICALVFMLSHIGIFGKLISRFVHQNYKKDFLLKYTGLPATARLIKSNQTGAYINAQPMIEFVLEFTDYRNLRHTVHLKKIVGLLDIATMNQNEVAIFYLKDDPKQVVFRRSLDELNFIYESPGKKNSPAGF